METKVKVWIRLQPTDIRISDKTIQPHINNEKEEGEGIVFTAGRNASSNFAYKQKFFFDRIIHESSTQKMVYDRRFSNLVSKIFSGMNVCIFAFGPTGCGKTFTMQGTKDKQANIGIIPRAVKQILRKAQKLDQKATQDAEEEGSKTSSDSATDHMAVSVSFLELYNDKLVDLLENQTKAGTGLSGQLEIREDNNGRTFVKGLSNKKIKSFSEFSTLYENACSRRKQGATKMNRNSSRSHSILTLKVRYKSSPKVTVFGKLHLIDLAGNEDNRKTGNSGHQMTESGNINLSLFALGKVISCLNTKDPKRNGGNGRIPYRDSKLTRLLKDSLGGDSLGLMICCVNGHPQMTNETAQALQFASKAKNITNYAKEKIILNKEEEDIKIQTMPTPSGKNKRKPTEDMNAKLEAWKLKKGKCIQKEPSSTVTEKSKSLPSDALKKPVPKEKLEDAESHGEKVVLETEPVKNQQGDQPKPTIDQTLLKKNIDKAKELIIKAKEIEASREYHEALRVYKMAQDFLPNHSKLLKRILALEAKVGQDKENQPGHENMQNGSLSTALSFDSMDPHSRCELTFSDSAGGIAKHEDYSQPPTPKASSIKSALESQMIDVLNCANKAQLQCLNGIGKKRAEQIVEKRCTSPFKKLDDLMKIGLSTKQISKIANDNAMSVIQF